MIQEDLLNNVIKIMRTKKQILKKYTGKGGMKASPYKQVASPIDLLKTTGEPPTAEGVPKTKDNYLGNKLTR